VPVTDPNNPTRLHRQAKAEAYRQMVAAAPTAFDPKKAILKYSDEVGLTGVEDTLSPTLGQPQQPPVDPAKMADIQHKNDKLKADAATDAQKTQADMAMTQMELQDKAAERENKLKVAQIDMDTERLRLASTIAIHSDKMDEAQKGANIKLMSDHASQAHDHADQMERAQQAHEHSTAQGDVAHERSVETADAAHERSKDMAAHTAKLAPKPAGKAAKPKKAAKK
jgi:hypothetical protein